MKGTSSVIMNHIGEKLKKLEIVDVVDIHSPLVQAARDKTRINVKQVEDGEFEDWSSIDVKGKELEIDFQVGVRLTPMEQEIFDGQAAQVAFDQCTGIAMQIISALSENSGVIMIEGSRVLAESASQRESIESEDEENVIARLDVEYSFLYRVKRDAPDTLY